MLRRWTLLALVVGLVLLVSTLPLRLVLGASGVAERGFAARAVTGSIWSGQLVDARLGVLDLGTLDVGLAPASLLRGRIEADFSRPANALDPPLAGRLRLAGGGQGVADVRGSLSLRGALGLVPLDRVELDGVSLAFDGAGRCVEGSGRAALFAALPGLASAQGLNGPVQCTDAGRAALRLASQSGMEQLVLDVGGGGDYRAQIRIRDVGDPLLAGALQLAGFTVSGDALVLTTRGQF